MFEVKISTDLNPPGYIFNGVIDDTVDFKSLIPEGPHLNFYCKQVSRINSMGIKYWRDFFQALRKKGMPLKFYELSPALVSTVNYLSDFIQREEIASLTAPYICTTCNTITLQICNPDQAKSLIGEVKPIPCANCGKDAEFDELPEEYFAAFQD